MPITGYIRGPEDVGKCLHEINGMRDVKSFLLKSIHEPEGWEWRAKVDSTEYGFALEGTGHDVLEAVLRHALYTLRYLSLIEGDTGRFPL